MEVCKGLRLQRSMNWDQFLAIGDQAGEDENISVRLLIGYEGYQDGGFRREDSGCLAILHKWILKNYRIGN